MKEVERHSVTGYGRQDINYNDPEGEFVYYEDYAKLQQQLTATTNSLTNAQEALKSAGIEADTVQAGVMELEKQSPVAVLGQQLRGYEKPTFICYLLIDENNGEVEEGSELFAEPFIHPEPAIDMNAVRAEGLDMAAAEIDRWVGCGSLAREIRQKSIHIRAGNAGKHGVKKTINALPVERDQHGYWSHPDYLAFCDGREFIPNAEWEQWMSERGLHWQVEYRDEEELEPNVDGYDLSTWQPKAPDGEGWFVGSIHDTEDGAVCIWLRAGNAGKGVEDGE